MGKRKAKDDANVLKIGATVLGHCDTCDHMAHWTENQSPLGSGENWPMHFSECGNDKAQDEDRDPAKTDGAPCPFWKADIEFCRDHGFHLAREGCLGCMAKAYQDEPVDDITSDGPPNVAPVRSIRDLCERKGK